MSPHRIKDKVALAIFEHREAIAQWFDEKFAKYPASFYCSVDIRDSGDKIAPVDCNLFPAGFNNICEVDREVAPPLFKEQITRMAKGNGLAIPEKILIIPENHTENKFYLENLFALKSIMEDAGFEVELGRYDGEKTTFELTTASEKHITEYSVSREGDLLKTNSGFCPDWVILNNDFSQGYPECLDGITQPIFPTYKLGWHTRKKSTHFEFYNELATEFANLVKIEPWYLTIESKAVENVNFAEGTGMDRVIETADEILAKLRTEYAAHKIDRTPALFIKNDAGTYGMGIMVIESSEELKTMNRRTKNKMSMGKNKSAIDQVLLQEGIPTQLVVDGHTSEPVIYMMGEELIGGFIRSNSERDDMDNLNSQGMFFKKLCFKDLKESLTTGTIEDLPELEAIYGLVAKLSALAAAMEIKDTQ